MKLLNVISSLFFFILSICISIASWNLKIGTYKIPGSGFLPFWIGIFIGFLALLLLMQTLIKGNDETEENTLKDKKWKNILLVLASLFVYTLMLEKIGFIISTFLFMAFLPRLIEVKKWHMVLIVAILSALGAYLVFEVWLKTQLPRGILI